MLYSHCFTLILPVGFLLSEPGFATGNNISVTLVTNCTVDQQSCLPFLLCCYFQLYGFNFGGEITWYMQEKPNCYISPEKYKVLRKGSEKWRLQQYNRMFKRECLSWTKLVVFKKYFCWFLFYFYNMVCYVTVLQNINKNVNLQYQCKELFGRIGQFCIWEHFQPPPSSLGESVKEAYLDIQWHSLRINCSHSLNKAMNNLKLSISGCRNIIYQPLIEI